MGKGRRSRRRAEAERSEGRRPRRPGSMIDVDGRTGGRDFAGPVGDQVAPDMILIPYVSNIFVWMAWVVSAKVSFYSFSILIPTLERHKEIFTT